jgi:hypothetical protein
MRGAPPGRGPPAAAFEGFPAGPTSRGRGQAAPGPGPRPARHAGIGEAEHFREAHGDGLDEALGGAGQTLDRLFAPSTEEVQRGPAVRGVPGPHGVASRHEPRDGARQRAQASKGRRGGDGDDGHDDEVDAQELLPDCQADEERRQHEASLPHEEREAERAQGIHLGVLADVVEREGHEEAGRERHERAGDDGGPEAAERRASTITAPVQTGEAARQTALQHGRRRRKQPGRAAPVSCGGVPS